jgi:hypothetical protein
VDGMSFISCPRAAQRSCSRTKATNAARVSGMGRGGYHSVDAPGYCSLDSVQGTGLESRLFRPHDHLVLRGGGGSSLPGSTRRFRDRLPSSRGDLSVRRGDSC